jgi:hypothetical protein
VGTYAQVLGGVGTLLAGLAAVVALLLAGGRGDPPAATAPAAGSAAPTSASPSTIAPASPAPSVSPSTAVPTAPGSPAIPSFGAALFEHPMTSGIPGVPTDAEYSGCTQQLAAGRGYTIAAEGRALTCRFPISGASSRLAGLLEVRVEVSVDFDRFTPAAAADYAPGGATVLCRMTAPERGGTYYDVVLAPNGFWQIDRYVDGQAKALGFGTVPSLTTDAGGTRRITLECAGTAGGPTLVRLSVDGRELAIGSDPDGLPAGAVGLGIVDFPGPEIAVTFHDVEVSAP